jgi:predicted enzyme related to lactoylglutathione lyase
MADEPRVGAIAWIDLTVPNATAIRDFYREVVGWTATEVAMGDHSDYCMHAASGEDPVTGICHALGSNADLPPHWLIYITVTDLETSVSKCVALGGKVLVEPRALGAHGRMCVIQDPAGGVAALHCAK